MVRVKENFTRKIYGLELSKKNLITALEKKIKWRSFSFSWAIILFVYLFFQYYSRKINYYKIQYKSYSKTKNNSGKLKKL